VRAEYAQVLRMLGNGRLEAQCIDGIKRLCHIRGKMRKKVWVNMVRFLPLCIAGAPLCVSFPPCCCDLWMCLAVPANEPVLPAGQRLTKICCRQGDIILVGLRDYQDEKADVILK